LTPITAERSVLKLKGDRAEKKGAHWQGVAVAASEQCGRNRVTRIDPACSLAEWLTQHPASLQTGLRLVLSLAVGSQALKTAVQGHTRITLLSGPEGGLTPAEEALALAAGFLPVSLGPRVLRAETAPLAVLAALTL
jgi:16S rRNA (uracil1498-N3)-methyltransferase